MRFEQASILAVGEEFESIEKDFCIDKTVWKLISRICVKAEVKRACIKLGLIKAGTVYSVAISKQEKS